MENIRYSAEYQVHAFRLLTSSAPRRSRRCTNYDKVPTKSKNEGRSLNVLANILLQYYADILERVEDFIR